MANKWFTKSLALGLAGLALAGCPADDFSPLGQLWGNPIYNWEAMKEDGCTWWSKRLQASFEFI